MFAFNLGFLAIGYTYKYKYTYIYTPMYIYYLNEEWHKVTDIHGVMLRKVPAVIYTSLLINWWAISKYKPPIPVWEKCGCEQCKSLDRNSYSKNGFTVSVPDKWIVFRYCLARTCASLNSCLSDSIQRICLYIYIYALVFIDKNGDPTYIGWQAITSIKAVLTVKCALTNTFQQCYKRNIKLLFQQVSFGYFAFKMSSILFIFWCVIQISMYIILSKCDIDNNFGAWKY